MIIQTNGIQIIFKNNTMDIKKLNDIMNQSRLKKKEAGLNLKTLRLKQQTYEAGVVSGHQHYLSKTGLFSRSEEKVKKDSKKGGKITGEKYKGKALKDWMENNPELTFEQNSKIGKKQGKKNVKSGHLAKVRVNGGKNASEIEYECEHCNKKINGAVYFRWHGDNCSELEKIKEQLTIIKKLNKKTFTSNDIIALCKKLKYNYRRIKYGILKNIKYIDIVKVGTNQTNPTIFKLK
jgi:hypothetical protein